MHTKELLHLIEHPEESPFFRASLEAIANRYPWFGFAKELLLQSYAAFPEENPTKQKLKRETALRALACNYRPVAAGRPGNKETGSPTQDAISRFMATPPKRIPLPRPGQSEDANEDLAGENNRIPEAISETLAGIYERQGLYDQAIDIYRKLSLKYPEKSIYFANRIQHLETGITGGQQ